MIPEDTPFDLNVWNLWVSLPHPYRPLLDQEFIMRDRKSDTIHRKVAESKLGRKLAPNEVVDHLNEDKTDQSPANLAAKDRAAHTRQHNMNRPLSKLRASLRMIKERKRLY